jgi:arylsulfatase A-like enzyme
MFAYQKVQRSLRDERYKLIRYPQVDRTQLFDLAADPDERTDLSARPEHSARVATMTAALAAEMKRLGDPQPLSVASPRPATWSPPPARVKK